MRDTAVRFTAVVIAVLVTLLVPAPAAHAQGTGTVRGVVTRSDDGTPIRSVQVTVVGGARGAVSGPDGRYTLSAVPVGSQTIEFRLLGFMPQRASVNVAEGQVATVDATMEASGIRLADIIVNTASRAPERLVEAPAAVAVVDPQIVQAAAPTGQAPLVLMSVPGVDVTQSGITDFNVNARGFNSTLTRRVLVLQDGRDPAIAFLGSQEWSAAGMTLDDATAVEMVRGPGSALYGANAFSGILSITSPTAREALGSRFTIAAGELGTRRVSGRHAAMLGQRFGYKIGAGYSSSDSWTRSRTSRDSTDIVREYQPTTEVPVRKSREAIPLVGQQLDATTLAATGTPDPIENTFGQARLDYYALNGSLATVEGGLADVRNETFITGLGRVQVAHAQRPWARAAWGSQRLNLLAWYTGRDSRDPQWSLGSGSFFLEKSAIVHGEAQYNDELPGNRGRWIVGASARSTHMNTSRTLVDQRDDDRDDKLYSAYGQLDLDITSRLKLVSATRWDRSDLFDAQFSPKAALVFSIDERRSVRASVNRAFQTPNYSELFLSAPAGAPTASPRTLELALNSFFATGAAIGTTGLPTALPWNFAAQTRVLALGNRDLDVEKVTGYEVGFKSGVLRDGFVTLDLYWNDTKDFVTDLLPGVNPAYPRYSYNDGGTDVPAYLNAIRTRAQALPPGAIPDAQRAAIIAGANTLLANYNALVAATQPLLTTVDGQRALVVSYTNAARVVERGLEIGLATPLAGGLRGQANYSFFEFEVKRASAGTDALLPNTPKHKGFVGLTYQAGRRVDFGTGVRLSKGYQWAAGVFNGWVPSSYSVNANAGFEARPGVKLFVTGTNVLDERRFQMYGGSVLGRRIIGGVTAAF